MRHRLEPRIPGLAAGRPVVAVPARISVEAETSAGWKTVAESSLPENTINRRQVLRFPTVTTAKIRIRLHDSNRDLRLCEVRVYE